jgi:hypothetical protein
MFLYMFKWRNGMDRKKVFAAAKDIFDAVANPEMGREAKGEAKGTVLLDQ